jgi:hypothetical protein
VGNKLGVGGGGGFVRMSVDLARDNRFPSRGCRILPQGEKNTFLSLKKVEEDVAAWSN